MITKVGQLSLTMVPPGEWYNAIRALLIASVDGVDPCSDLALPPGRRNILRDLQVQQRFRSEILKHHRQ